MQRKIFAFRFEWMEAIASYDPNVRLEIYEATVIYAETGTLPAMSPQAALGFETYILPDFERRRKAAEYRARAKARREGRQVPPQEVQTVQAEPVVAAVAELPEIVMEPTPELKLNRRERRQLEAEQRRKQKRRLNKNCHNLP